MQLAFLAQFPREMSQTDRIHPRYFLLWIRVSIRPRYFVNAKKPIPGQTSPRPGRMLQRHRPSERRNLKRRLYLHARWRLTSAGGVFIDRLRKTFAWTKSALVIGWMWHAHFHFGGKNKILWPADQIAETTQPIITASIPVNGIWQLACLLTRSHCWTNS